MKNVLGLDISTKTGFSRHYEDGTMLTREIEFKKLKGMERVLAFHDEIVLSIGILPADLVVVEGYGYASNNIVPSVEIGTAIRMALHTANVKYITVAPTMLKKFVTGRGIAPKEVMMMETFKRWGFEAKTNNEADAFGLAKIGMMMIDVHKPTNAYERETYDKLKEQL